jgi:DNA mismatch repair protein MutH
METGQTCERCGTTGAIVVRAYNRLKRALAELGIEVRLETEALDFTTFTNDPLQSNRIWIGGRLLEDWLGASVGQSPCCDVCGGSECRTLAIASNTFESVPEEFIIKAGLLAAAELFAN